MKMVFDVLTFDWILVFLSKANTEAHLVLLSPPDLDDGVSESVCQLGSLLSDWGFSVSVDQWSRRAQCSLGPLPWLHSQLQQLSSLRGRVLLLWTSTAAPSHQQETRQVWSPYSDVFTACLGLIEAEKKLGRTSGRFVLVKLDSGQRGDGGLPDLLQGLPLFQLPSQTQALLSELGARWTWTRWTRCRAKRAQARRRHQVDRTCRTK